MTPKFSTLLVFLVTCFSATSLYAAELFVSVLDQTGKPLANAVVESPGNPVTSAPEEIAIIDQVNKRFVPMVIVARTGQSVNFPNNDNIRHHVYSFSAIKQFSTELYADNPASPVTFDKPGIATLGCNIHDSMVGYIYVSDWQDAGVTDATGILPFTLASIPEEISVWHPWSNDPDKRRTVSTQGVSDGGSLEVRLNITPPDQVFGFRALSAP